MPSDLLNLWEAWDEHPSFEQTVIDLENELKQWSAGTGLPVTELRERMAFLRRCGMTREQVVGFLENLRYF